MKEYILITGASSGIGLEMAKLLAAKNFNLILVARNEDKLLKLQQEIKNLFKIEVKYLLYDLSEPNSAADLYLETKEHNYTITGLINNAGFGRFGPFHEMSWEQVSGMINLNITALTQLCHLFISDMKAAGSGKILNIASTAAFQPGPGMAVYYATKAFVLHFSEAINHELRNTGVSVTAACPGPTSSGFQHAAGLDDSWLFNGRKVPTSAEVAEWAYNAMMKNKSVAIHGAMNNVMAFGTRFSPRDMNTAIAGYVQGRK
jgi:short-subunit dehydrogenase